jgi:hypothetical protein
MVYSKVFGQKGPERTDLKVANTRTFKIPNKKVVKHAYPNLACGTHVVKMTNGPFALKLFNGLNVTKNKKQLESSS